MAKTIKIGKKLVNISWIEKDAEMFTPPKEGAQISTPTPILASYTKIPKQR